MHLKVSYLLQPDLYGVRTTQVKKASVQEGHPAWSFGQPVSLAKVISGRERQLFGPWNELCSVSRHRKALHTRETRKQPFVLRFGKCQRSCQKRSYSLLTDSVVSERNERQSEILKIVVTYLLFLRENFLARLRKIGQLKNEIDNRRLW